MSIFLATGLNTEMTAHDLTLRTGVPIEAPFLGMRSLIHGLERLGLGHEVTFCDAYNLRLTTAEVVARALAARPRIVAVGALYDQWDRGFTTIAEHGTRHLMVRLRAELPDAILIFGGRAAAASSVDEILATGADAVFMGECDHSFPEVVRRLLVHELPLEKAVEGFDGISFRMTDRQVRRHLSFPMVADLSTIPAPRVERIGRALFVHDQRGCLATCTYCSAKNNIRDESGRQAMRFFDVEELKDEFLAHLSASDARPGPAARAAAAPPMEAVAHAGGPARGGEVGARSTGSALSRGWETELVPDKAMSAAAPPIERIYLTANTYFSDRPRGWDLLDWLLKHSDATIGCTVTPQDVLDPYMWEKLTSVSDPQRIDLAMGVESFSPRVLKLFGRPVKPPELLEILRRLFDAGLMNLTLFYIGIDPFRTVEDLRTEKDALFSLADEPLLLLQTVWQLEEFYRHLVFYPATPLERLARPYEPWQLAYKYLMEPLFLLRKTLPARLMPVIEKARRSSMPAPLKARLVATLFPPLLDWLERFFDSALDTIEHWGDEPVLRPELSLDAHHIPNKGFSILLSQKVCQTVLPFTDAFAQRLTDRYATLHELGIESPLDRV